MITDLETTATLTRTWRAKATRAEDTLQLARVDLADGLLHRKRGDFIAAADFLMSGLEKVSPVAAPSLWAQLNNELGTVYARLFMHAESIERYQQALAVSEANNDLPNAQYAYYQLYERYSFPNPDSARYYKARFEETLPALPLNAVRAAEVAIMRGRELFFQDSFERAVAVLTGVVDDSHLRQDFDNEAVALQELAWAQLNAGRVAAARATVDRVFALSENTGLIYHRYYGLPAKIALDTMSGRWETAFTDFGELFRLNNRLISGQNRQRIVELENKFAAKEQAQAIEAVRQENLLFTLRSESQTRHSILLCLLAILLAMLAGGGWWRYRAAERDKVIISAQSEEKTLLMRELHHRAKNNLSTIEGLLNLQLDVISRGDATGALQRSRERISSITLIHEQLYHSETAGSIDAAPYLRELVGRLVEDTEDVRLTTHLDSVKLDLAAAVPLGLIVNEAVVNALEHGKGAGKKALLVTVRLEYAAGDRQLALTVSDDGVGFPSAVLKQRHEYGGLHIIQGLVQQQRGSVRMENNPGATVSVQIPVQT